MSNWNLEFPAEYHRQRIWEEVEQIRLERLVQSRVYRPRFFARTMFSFANWMISTGKHLRERYTRSTPQSGSVDEIPAVDCSQAPTGSLAR